MAVTCTCPAASALTTITKETCGIDLGQVQRLAFSRIGANFTNADDANDITKLAAWQTKLAATDDTKIIVSPLIGGDPIIDAGDAITTGGGDNSTLNGIEEVNGINPSLFTCNFKSMTPRNEREMKQMRCELQFRVYFFLQGGTIAAAEVTVGGTPNQGFLANNAILSDRNNAGFGTKDTNDFRFSLPAGWSENLTIITPEFDPLTAL